MKTKKRILFLAVTGILAAGALSFYLLGSSSSGYLFQTVSVEKGSICNTITATGTLEATNTVIVGTQVSGVIEKLYVDFNSLVEKGQLIAELDKSTLISSLETAQADLDKAQAELEYRTANHMRSENLYEKGMLAQSDYDLAVYHFKLSSAGVKSAQANVDRATRNLGYASIYSPIDGIVLNRAVEEGQTVTASMSTPELFTITNDLSTMQVEANIDEADIGLLESGQRVEFDVDAFPGLTFDGQVSEIRLQPNESSNVVTYIAIISVSNPDLKLKPGMTASITAYIEEANDVLLVAQKATRFTPDKQSLDEYMRQLSIDQTETPSDTPDETRGDNMRGPHPETMQELDDSHKMVWIKNGDVIRSIVIEVGIDDGSNIQVISGLEEGSTVVTSFENTSISELAELSRENDEQKSPFVQEGRRSSGNGGGPGGPPPH